MPSTLPFWTGFVVTVALLAAALFTGTTRRRRAHLCLAPAAMLALGVTIVLTEALVRRYDFPADTLRFHLFFAKAAGLLALPVIATGVALWRTERARLWHRAALIVWLTSVAVATTTGLWMFGQGTPKPF